MVTYSSTSNKLDDTREMQCAVQQGVRPVEYDGV